MAEQPCAQLHINTRSGVGKNIGAQPAQHHFKQRHHQQGNRNHIQRREAAVHQYFIHHHLKKQRCHQRKQLQHHRYRQHLQENPAVFDNGRNKPSEIKLGQLTQHRSAGGNQNQLAAVAPGKLGLIQHRRTPGHHILNQVAFPIDLSQHTMLPVFTPHHRRQCQHVQPRQIMFHRLGLQPQLLGGQQPFGFGQILPVGSKAVQNIGRIGGHTVEMSHQNQSGQSRGGRRWMRS